MAAVRSRARRRVPEGAWKKKREGAPFLPSLLYSLEIQEHLAPSSGVMGLYGVVASEKIKSHLVLNSEATGDFDASYDPSQATVKPEKVCSETKLSLCNWSLAPGQARCKTFTSLLPQRLLGSLFGGWS